MSEPTQDDPTAEPEVHAPVPHPGDDLSHLAVFEGDDETIEVGGHTGARGAGYDDETDLAVPVHQPDPGDAFTPFGLTAPNPGPQAAYDVDRDTGL